MRKVGEDVGGDASPAQLGGLEERCNDIVVKILHKTACKNGNCMFFMNQII